MKSQMKHLHEMIREFEPKIFDYKIGEIVKINHKTYGEVNTHLTDRESFEKMREVALMLAEVSQITLEYLEPRLEHKHGSKGKTVILPRIKTSIIEARKLLGEK